MPDDKTIYPTHTCFDDAIEMMLEILKANVTSSDYAKAALRDGLHLVHGIVMVTGKPSAHAWLEHDINNSVMFVGILDGKRENFSANREEYYRELKISEFVRYHFAEVMAWAAATGHNGPWIEKYRKLTRNTAVMDRYNIKSIGGLEPEC